MLLIIKGRCVFDKLLSHVVSRYNGCMDIVFYNNGWMLFNSELALLAVLFGFLFLYFKKGFLHYFFGLLWLLFLPNTIYMITDMIHLLRQWGRVNETIKVILLVQYFLLEVVCFATYLYGMIPFEKLLLKWRLRDNQKIWMIIAFNFLISFGMVLGRIERINSWDVFVNPVSVLYSAYITMTSSFHLLLFVLFGLFTNLFYFLFRDYMIRIAHIVRKKKS